MGQARTCLAAVFLREPGRTTGFADQYSANPTPRRSYCPLPMGARRRIIRATMGPQNAAFGELLGPLLLLAPADSGLDECVDLAVEHRARIARLVFGAEIFHHLVRMQDVGAHLVTPRAGHVAPDRVHPGQLL